MTLSVKIENEWTRFEEEYDFQEEWFAILLRGKLLQNSNARYHIECDSSLPLQHISGYTSDVCLFLSKFEKIIRENTCEKNITTSDHIEPFMTKLFSFIRESPYYYNCPDFEIYFDIDTSETHYVLLDQFQLFCEVPKELSKNRKKIEFSFFLYPQRLGFYGDVAPIFFDGYPKLHYSFIPSTHLLNSNVLDDFFSNMQKKRNGSNSLADLIETVKGKFLGITSVSEKYKTIFNFYPNPVSFGEVLENGVRIPNFRETKPVSLQPVLQRDKFILNNLLPIHCLMELIKKMNIKEFIEIHCSNKYIAKLIQNNRHTFIKDAADRIEFSKGTNSEKRLIVDGVDLNPFKKEDFIKNFIIPRKGFNFPGIEFRLFEEADMLRNVLGCFKGSNILTDNILIGNCPLLQEFFDVFQIKSLSIFPYYFGTMEKLFLSPSLELIEVDFTESEMGSFCNLMDKIFGFKGRMMLKEFFEDFDMLAEDVQSMLRMKKRNLNSKQIIVDFDVFINDLNIFDQHSTETFKDLFPASNDNFFSQQVMQSNWKKEKRIIRKWQYGIFMQKFQHGIVVVLALNSNSAKNFTWTMKISCDFIASMEEFKAIIQAIIVHPIVDYSEPESIVTEVQLSTGTIAQIVLKEDQIVDASVYSEIEERFFSLSIQ